MCVFVRDWLEGGRVAAAEDLIWAMRRMVVGLGLVSWGGTRERQEALEGGASGSGVV